MRTITTTAGTSITLDGDVLAVLEAISRDLWRRTELEYGFEDVDREVPMLVRMFEKRLRGYRAIGYARDNAPFGYAQLDDEPVIEYSTQVGVARTPIAAGDYVHVHNMKTARW